METVIVVNDMQIPFHDAAAIDCVLDVTADLNPDMVIFLGDIMDFPGLSTKFRREPKDQHNLHVELAVGRRVLQEFRGMAPRARMVYVEGNHEARLHNYIVELADELYEFSELGVLSIPNLLRLEELNVEYVGPYGAAFEHHSLVFKHGERATQFTAAAELRVEGSSGMSAHTHRGGSYFNTNRTGAHAWYENFCLCNIKGPHQPPKAITGTTNWQQGFSVIYFNEGIFNVFPTVITEGHCIFGGRVYGNR